MIHCAADECGDAREAPAYLVNPEALDGMTEEQLNSLGVPGPLLYYSCRLDNLFPVARRVPLWSEPQ